MNPGGGSGWDEPPLDIQIPDDARELDRDVLAYRRELRAQRRRNRLLRLAGPFRSFGARGTVMPLLASILAVCLVAGAMLSVATFSPAAPPAEQTPKATASATALPRSAAPALASATGTAATATAAGTAAASTAVSSPSGSRASHPASPSASASRTHPTVQGSGPGSPAAPR